MALVDIILGYDCNLSCDYCTITPQMRERSLSTEQIREILYRASRAGYDEVQLTGGEPTIRPDLMGLVAFARRIGFSGVIIQSNGLMWSSASNVDRAIRAGCTLFNVSVHTHLAEEYDALVRRPGAHRLMVSGLRNLVERGVDLVAALIIKQDTHARLPAAVEWLASQGVRRVDLWFVSLTDGNASNTASMPRMTDTLESISAAAERASADGVTLRSLHIPHCLLGPLRTLAWNPASQRVRVVSPDAEFDLAQSKLTPGVFVPACTDCPHRGECAGLRRDYLARYGDEEVAFARGRAPSTEARVQLPRVT